MKARSVRVRTTATLLSVGLLVAACGSSPSSTGDGGNGSGSSSSGSLDSVYAAVQGLTGDARYQKLLSLAKAEGGSIGFYHSGDLTPEVKAFQSQTGLKIADFQATSERAAEKVNTEHKAGRPGADVIIGGAQDLIALNGTGSLATLTSPVTDDVTDDYKETNLVAPITILELPTYNTNAVKKDQAPKDWTEYFTTFSKRKAIEVTDWEWYATIITKYFEAQKHMTEADAIKLITNGMKGASAVDGHTLVAQLLASGQYDFVPNVFYHYLPGLLSKGAPLSYDDVSADLPPTVVTELMGLTQGGKHPAGGLLFLEWMMGPDGSKVVASQGYFPVTKEYQGDSIAQKYPYALIDSTGEYSAADSTKWQKAFDTMLQQAGTKKRSS